MKENENACPNCHPSFSLCSWWAFIYLNIIVCLFQVAFWFCSDTALSINYMCQLENPVFHEYIFSLFLSWMICLLVTLCFCVHLSSLRARVLLPDPKPLLVLTRTHRIPDFIPLLMKSRCLTSQNKCCRGLSTGSDSC